MSGERFEHLGTSLPGTRPRSPMGIAPHPRTAPAGHPKRGNAAGRGTPAVELFAVASCYGKRWRRHRRAQCWHGPPAGPALSMRIAGQPVSGPTRFSKKSSKVSPPSEALRALNLDTSSSMPSGQIMRSPRKHLSVNA